MYQLRSQIDLFYLYNCKRGVLTYAQLYLKGEERVPGAFFEVKFKYGVTKKIF